MTTVTPRTEAQNPITRIPFLDSTPLLRAGDFAGLRERASGERLPGNESGP